MTRTRIAPRTYQDEVGRYWARFPVNRRYTWRLLKDATTKRDAIAAAQSCTGTQKATGFSALAAAYLAAKCPTRRQKFKRPSAGFIACETRQAAKLVEYFKTSPVAEVNDLLRLTPYSEWRFRQFKSGKGSRAVDKELQTLSNIINYAVFGTKQERINFIQSNRPRFHEVHSHARNRMPENADVIHQLCEYFFEKVSSEVFAWLTLFAMFTGNRTSELLRLRTDARQLGQDKYEPGCLTPASADNLATLYTGTVSLLHLERSKNGINHWALVGPEFAQMIECFHRWHAARFPKSKVYFPGPFGTVVDAGSHGHALTRACKHLGLPNITPHGLRAYYATKRRRDRMPDALVAAELGDTTVALISSTYGETPGKAPLFWKPREKLPAWLHWQAEAEKVVQFGKT